jgi:hypothetical protein
MMARSQCSYARYLVLRLSGGLVAVHGAALDWLSIQAGRGRRAATQAQPYGPGLIARRAASSLSCVSSCTPSFFLALQANSSRREVPGI